MVKSGIAAIVVFSGLVAAANAEVVYSWAVVSGSATLNPGETVTLGLFATHLGDFYAGGKFNIRIDGFTDGLAFAADTAGDTETDYLGRIPNGTFTGLRNKPPVINYSMVGNVLVGSGAGSSIDHATIPAILGGNPDPSPTIEFFRMSFTAGSTPGLRTIVTQFTDSQVAFFGIPSTQSFIDGSIDINVVPAPASLALLSLGGLVAGRRRR